MQSSFFTWFNTGVPPTGIKRIRDGNRPVFIVQHIKFAEVLDWSTGKTGKVMLASLANATPSPPPRKYIIERCLKRNAGKRKLRKLERAAIAATGRKKSNDAEI